MHNDRHTATTTGTHAALEPEPPLEVEEHNTDLHENKMTTRRSTPPNESDGDNSSSDADADHARRDSRHTSGRGREPEPPHDPRYLHDKPSPLTPVTPHDERGRDSSNPSPRKPDKRGRGVTNMIKAF